MTIKTWRTGASIVALMSAGLGVNGTGFAQTDQTQSSSGVLDEIVVTARRTSESINDAPLALSLIHI